MRTSPASYLYSIASEASRFKSGKAKVNIPFILVQNGHLKRLTDQDIQSSVL